MISILTTRDHRYTVTKYLSGPGEHLNGILRSLPYELVALRSSLPAGCYIFADLDRLSAPSMRFAAELHRSLSSDDGCTVLNDPSRSLTRYPLLREMERLGVNEFRARPVADWTELTFPIFLRYRNEHEGPLTPLLHSEADVSTAIEALIARGIPAVKLLAVEFFDTSDEHGMFKKYGALRLADRIVPRHMFFNTGWENKHRGLLDGEKVAAEIEFLRSNPHAEELIRIFDLAHIEYGRIDYAIHKGRVVVWEINTNPTLNASRRRLPGPKQELKARVKLVSRPLTARAFEAHDQDTLPAPRRVPLRIQPSVKLRVVSEMGAKGVRRRAIPSRAGRTS